jgi:hypothetical protein
MEYEASLKRAQRLLKSKFSALQAQGHALASMGLDVNVTDVSVTFYSAGRNYDSYVLGITIDSDGTVNGHYGPYKEGLNEGVEAALASILASYVANAESGAAMIETLSKQLAR